MTTTQVGELLARRALLVLLDRAGGEVMITTDEFDQANGYAVTVKAITEPPHFVLTLITEARCTELLLRGIPGA